MTTTRILLAAALAAAIAGPAAAQDHRAGRVDPAAAAHQDSRQYRSEPKANVAKRDTRCRIVRRRGQDRRVCGQPVRSGGKR